MKSHGSLLPFPKFTSMHLQTPGTGIPPTTMQFGMVSIEDWSKECISGGKIMSNEGIVRRPNAQLRAVSGEVLGVEYME